MTDLIEVRVPDIGDFDNVEVTELMVRPGDVVEAEASLIVLESDKASLELPAPVGGIVRKVHVTIGDTVSEGSPVATIEPSDSADIHAEPPAPQVRQQPAAPEPEQPSPTPPPRASSPAAPLPQETPLPTADIQTEVVVIGSGPGGYTAAFRAADLGKQVVLVERFARLGGVCLNVGCIPSKAMLHAAALIDEAAEFKSRGIDFGTPKFDLPALANWKDSVVDGLTGGLVQLAKKRGVTVVQGRATFTGEHTLLIQQQQDQRTLAYQSAIIAVGSRAAMLPGVPEDDDRLWTSNDAIRFDCIPNRLLVVGGGIIGLELAQVYASLGSRVTVVELLDGLMPGADRDLVRLLERRIKTRYENIFTATKVTAIKPLKRGLKVTMEGPKAPAVDTFDAVLVAVGRRPNGDRIGAEVAGIHVDTRGFVATDLQQRTNVAHIFAIGDVAGEPMLAHKATHEGKVAAEVIAGKARAFDASVIPSVAYTDPEVAWVGITEEEAAEQGVQVEKGRIPWGVSGRAQGLGRPEGLTKLLFDAKNGRLLGAGFVGAHAGDLIGEAALAIEMGANATDIGLTIHPHPTLSETLAFAAEAVEGTLTDLYLPKR